MAVVVNQQKPDKDDHIVWYGLIISIVVAIILVFFLAMNFRGPQVQFLPITPIPEQSHEVTVFPSIEVTREVTKEVTPEATGSQKINLQIE